MTRFELGGIAVWAKDADLVVELLRSDWRLKFLVAVLAERLRDRGVGLQLTCVERTVAETQAIYARQGRKPPTKISVHDLRPSRGADGVPIAVDELGGELPPNYLELGQEVADEVNELCKYTRGRSCVIWHDVAGIHFHIQSPSGELAVVADTARPTHVARGQEATT